MKRIMLKSIRNSLLLSLFLLPVFSISNAASLDFSKSLLEKTDAGEEANIIVTLQSGMNIERLQNVDVVDEMRVTMVADIQNAILNRLVKTDYKNLHRFKYVPQIALTVNKNALTLLLSDTNLQIVENRIRHPSLAQSVPRVFPNHNTTPYNGNNQWRVAVLDSGVDKNHSFLKTGSVKKVVSEACYSGGFSHPAVSSFCPGGALSSTAPGSGLPCPVSISGCDHGTHVAGIAVGDRDGSNIDGVARLGKVIAIQVFSRIDDFFTCFPDITCIGAFDSDVIKGLERVYALRSSHKIAAANMSLGGGLFSGACNSEPHKPIIDLLKNVKIATVIASGNDGSSTAISSPACISSAVAVGSTLDTSDTRSSFSNNSLMLDLYAPGSNITSSVPGGSFQTWNGTSMATPHVAGAWAVIKHAKPTATVSEIESALKSFGPSVTVAGVSRKRIDVRATLDFLAPKSDINVVPLIYELLLQ